MRADGELVALRRPRAGPRSACCTPSRNAPTPMCHPRGQGAATPASGARRQGPQPSRWACHSTRLTAPLRVKGRSTTAPEGLGGSKADMGRTGRTGHHGSLGWVTVPAGGGGQRRRPRSASRTRYSPGVPWCGLATAPSPQGATKSHRARPPASPRLASPRAVRPHCRCGRAALPSHPNPGGPCPPGLPRPPRPGPPGAPWRAAPRTCYRRGARGRCGWEGRGERGEARRARPARGPTGKAARG